MITPRLLTAVDEDTSRWAASVRSQCEEHPETMEEHLDMYVQRQERVAGMVANVQKLLSATTLTAEQKQERDTLFDIFETVDTLEEIHEWYQMVLARFYIAVKIIMMILLERKASAGALQVQETFDESSELTASEDDAFKDSISA